MTFLQAISTGDWLKNANIVDDQRRAGPGFLWVRRNRVIEISGIDAEANIERAFDGSCFFIKKKYIYKIMN